MKLRLLALTLTLCAIPFAQAQTSQSIDEKEAAYMKVVTERAAKIVVALNIDDTAKFARVRTIIAYQYRDLNNIHEERNATVKVLREQGGEDKDAKLKETENDADVKLYNLHCAYIAKLSSELTPEQVEKVKDGMTYGRAPRDYKAFCDMIPSLTDDQKRYIYTAIYEAREHAMDAESSDKKHAWFGKYRGRINNYLSAQGYDLNKEREESNKRMEAEKNK